MSNEHIDVYHEQFMMFMMFVIYLMFLMSMILVMMLKMLIIDFYEAGENGDVD